jgi:HSP20 family protein
MAARIPHMARIRSLKLRWLHGQLSELTYEHAQTFLAASRGARWQPAINVFRCDRAFCICIDLAGVAKEEITLLVEPGLLVVRGTRTSPEPKPDHGQTVRVLAMEIDSGPFERELRLPPEVDIEQVTAEQEDGLLWIRLPIQ